MEMTEGIYDNNEANMNGETPATTNHHQPPNSDRNNSVGRCYRLTAGFLLLLCILLLTTITVLSIKFNTLTKDHYQLQTSYINLTNENDQLLISYINLTKEHDQLLTSYQHLTIESNQLLTSYQDLAAFVDKLQEHMYELINKLIQMNETFQDLRCFGSRFYYISRRMKSWDQAREDCLEKKGNLVIINSIEEQEFVQYLTLGMNQGAYIGLTNKDGEFKWVDGTALKAEYWSKYNVFYKNASCVVNAYYVGTPWLQRQCEELHYWICEI